MEGQKFPQKIDARPKALNRLMIVPIVMALFLAGATGLLILKMTEERSANGERVSCNSPVSVYQRRSLRFYVVRRR